MVKAIFDVRCKIKKRFQKISEPLIHIVRECLFLNKGNRLAIFFAH